MSEVNRHRLQYIMSPTTFWNPEAGIYIQHVRVRDPDILQRKPLETPTGLCTHLLNGHSNTEDRRTPEQ